ncbi:878_t:CDS:2, partial [Diversispora eburnea]
AIVKNNLKTKATNPIAYKVLVDAGGPPEGAPEAGGPPEGAPEAGGPPEGAPEAGGAPVGAPEAGEVPEGASDGVPDWPLTIIDSKQITRIVRINT